jgi:hypothetical protein
VGKLLAGEAELGMGTAVGTLVCIELPALEEEVVAEIVAEVVELDRSEDAAEEIEADAESALSSR